MLTLDIAGDKRIIGKLDQAIKRIDNPKELLGKTGDLLIREFEDNFPKEGMNLNEKWKPLKPSTIAQRLRLGYPAYPILVRSGKLMQGFKKQVQKFQVRVHNPVSYFKYHQAGGKHLPQRRMILAPEWLKQEVVAVFADFTRKIFM